MSVTKAAQFKRRFTLLIFLAWSLPAIVGLAFIVFVDILSLQQILGILLTPLEPLFIIAWTGFAVWYLRRYLAPLSAWLAGPVREGADASLALQRMRQFPLQFWGLFLLYLLMAPASVIFAAEWYTDYSATAVDWFRIHLVALIISIIVGLPIFFTILDLFGRMVGDLPLQRPHVTIKLKVFLIGALVPLLVDTILVQYYWTRTGYFSFETLVIWIFLEVLAIIGSLIFVRSLGQSLRPMYDLIGHYPLPQMDQELRLQALSTDEMGVLTQTYADLVKKLSLQNDILKLHKQVLQRLGERYELPDLLAEIIDLTKQVVTGDRVFLILLQPGGQELLCVATDTQAYTPEGIFSLEVNDQSLMGLSCIQAQTIVSNDVANDDRASRTMQQTFSTRSAMVSPLKYEGEIAGVLMTTHVRVQHVYDVTEVALFESLASEAGLALHASILSERREVAESTAEESEQRIRLLLDSTSEAIYGVDLQGTCTFVNAACVRMLGYQHEDQLLGQHMNTLLYQPGADEAVLEQALDQNHKAVQTGEPAHVEGKRFRRADGSDFPVEYWSHPIRKNGKTIGTVVTFFDMTHELEVQQAKEQAELRLHSVVSNIQVVLFALDADGVFTFSEGKGLQEIGLKPGEVVGLSAFELYRDNPQICADIQTALSGETLISTVESSGFWFETYYTPLLDDAGNCDGTIGVAINVTDRKQAEVELKNYQHNLEELVRQRTDELEQVNQELEAFSYSVSHDLRAPLRSIDGFSQAVLEDYADTLDGQGKDYLGRVRKAAQKMAELIDAMLNLSRITRTRPEFRSVDLSALAEEVSNDLNTGLETEGPDISIRQGIAVRGDEHLLRVLLQNLLSNAIKYSSKSAQAEISLGVEIQDDRPVIFVRDNGAGFDMRYADKLFSPFQRLHTDEDFRGTGIGLATVQRVVKLHGGTVWAESVPGEGATFYVELPEVTVKS